MTTRRLAAIVAADVVGYSRLMGTDEEGTLNALKAHRRALVDPVIAEHHGRIVKTTGDGMLVEFASVVDAVACSVAVQRGMLARNAEIAEDRRITFRMGINLGDVIIEGDDILGDGVNVAARLEALCEPGGICLSRAARDQVRDRVPFKFTDFGEHVVKNIARPIRAFGLAPADIAATAAPVTSSGGDTGLGNGVQATSVLPGKASIAVLPFTNMSGDPEQEYFADGMTEEIITALSNWRDFFVIARTTSFIYKGKTVDVKQIGRELGVRYVLEGSVRKAGDRVRVTGQLIDATSGAHLWADRFEGTLENIFELQDHVTSRVASAIGSRIEQAEFERIRRVPPTESPGAYDLWLRAVDQGWRLTRQSTDEAMRLAHKAITLDPDFAYPYSNVLWCHSWRKWQGWEDNPGKISAEAEGLARRGAELSRDDAHILSWMGWGIAAVAGKHAEGAAMLDRALQLNPNLVRAWNLSGWVRLFLGQHNVAIEHCGRAVRLGPLDPGLPFPQGAIALGHFFAGRHDEAITWAEKASQGLPFWLLALCTLTAISEQLGRMERARETMTRIREVDPQVRLSNLADRFDMFRPDDLGKLANGLQKAGLPE
jgi:adenylate cyclase